MDITVTHIDTACMVLDIGGCRILTDPVFDPPGSLYHFGFGTFSRKRSTPALEPGQLGRIDVVLLSHDQHQDNLDRRGRAVLASAPLVLSTRPAARRIPGVVGLADWESHRVPGTDLTVTATPAQHAGLRILNPLAGKVVGFVLEWPGQDGVYYISGDTVYFPGIDRIAARWRSIDTAFLHTGRAGFPYLTGPLPYTFHAEDALRAIAVLQPRRVIPVHCAGWWHFREPEERARAVYAGAGLGDRVLHLAPGEPRRLA